MSDIKVEWKGKRNFKNQDHSVTVSRRKKSYYVKLKKGRRDISLSPEMWAVLCDLKEVVMLCRTFLETT